MDNITLVVYFYRKSVLVLNMFSTSKLILTHLFHTVQSTKTLSFDSGLRSLVSEVVISWTVMLGLWPTSTTYVIVEQDSK